MAPVTALVVFLGWIGVVRACPACECEDSTERPGALIINCNFRGLTQIPDFNPDSFPYFALTMVGNRISSIPDDAFAGITFEKLDLTDNIISSVSTYAFRGQESNMKELILHTNQMSTFPTAAVNLAYNLEKLTLDGFYLTSLPSRPFRELTRLRELTITDSNLASLESDTLSDQADTLTVLNLHKNSFRSVPTAALQTTNQLQALDLHENQISRLEGASFTGLILAKLDLSQNSVTSLSVSAFAPLASSLESLNLRSTNMVDSRLGGLRSLVNLRTLFLDYNNIENIPTDLLDNMRSMEFLSAQNNMIGSITDQMLQGAGNSLKHLNLENNQIQGSGSVLNPFSGLRVLEELYLDGQNISPQLEENAFDQQQNTLRILSLSNTGFSSADFAKVNNLKALKTLRLAGNSISSVPDMSFLQMPNLENLYLEDNSIQNINQKSIFGTQNSLDRLNFDNNRIATLGHCTFYMFNINIYDISLAENPLICDCRLKWLKDMHDRQRDPALDFLLNWKCDAPSNLRGQLFRDVPVSDFLCNPPQTFPPCQDITPTTTSTTTTPVPTPSPTPSVIPGTTEKPEALVLNITGVTDTSMLVTWQVEGVPNLNGFLIQHWQDGDVGLPGEQYESKNARQSLIQNLYPETDYHVCVELLLRQDVVWNFPTKACERVLTKEQGLPLVPPPNVGIIVGAAVGGIAVLALIIVLTVFLVRRHRKKNAQDQPDGGNRNVPFSFSATGTPRLGTESKRFSKPSKSENLQNYKNEGLSKSIEGFTAEERNRIFDMLKSRGSTMSIVSAGSATRYVPEPRAIKQRPPSLPPRPQDMEGYLNPVMLRDNGAQQYPPPRPASDQPNYPRGGQQPHYMGGNNVNYSLSGQVSPGINPAGYAPMNTHLYSEIPADGAYEEIPAGHIQTDSSV